MDNVEETLIHETINGNKDIVGVLDDKQYFLDENNSLIWDFVLKATADNSLDFPGIKRLINTSRLRERDKKDVMNRVVEIENGTFFYQEGLIDILNLVLSQTFGHLFLKMGHSLHMLLFLKEDGKKRLVQQRL